MTEPKVCVLTSVHDPFDARIFHKEARSLARAGWQVTLFAPGQVDSNSHGVTVKAVPRQRGRLQRAAVTTARLYRRALAENADVYHLHDPELLFAGMALAARKKRVIYDAHEDLPRQILNKSYLSPRIRKTAGWLADWLEPAAVRRLSAVVAATPTIGQRLSKVNPRTVVVQNFPDLDEWQLPQVAAWTTRPNSIAFVGQISVYRGLLEMVAAMARLPSERHARLVLAGTFVPAGLPGELAEAPGWDRCEVAGQLDRTRLARMLANVRAGLVLTHPLTAAMQSYPVKLFEYMAAGLPVVTSDFPLWRRIVEGANCGLLVNPLDSTAIAMAIDQLLTHPDEAESLGAAGRLAIQTTYNWANEEKKLVGLYRWLLDRTPH